MHDSRSVTIENDVRNVLHHFHISNEKWNALRDKLVEQQNNLAAFNKLESDLLDIWNTSNAISKKAGIKLSSYTLINWSDILLSSNPSVDVVLGPILHRPKNTRTKSFDSKMASVYLGLTVVGLALSVLVNVDFKVYEMLKSDLSRDVQGFAWNYFDTIGGIAQADRQLSQGEAVIGYANLLASAQLAACSIIANIATFSSAITLPASTIAGLTGFSFAACMVMSCIIESHEALECNKRAKELQEQLDQAKTDAFFMRENPDEKLVERIKFLEKSILIEKAQAANHLRSADAYLGCALAMTALAVIGYLGLTAVTCGGLPIITIAIGVLSVITGMVRKVWVAEVDHVENVKEGITPNEKGESLLTRLNKAINSAPTPEFQKLLANQKLRLYLNEMIIKDPEKLRKILVAIETKDTVGFKDELSKHRKFQMFPDEIRGKTIGSKIVDAIEADDAMGMDNLSKSARKTS